MVTVPKKPTTPDEMWPSKAFEKSDGIYLQYRYVTVGPFQDMGELKTYDDQVQAISRGEQDPNTFVGRVIRFGDAYYVERWDSKVGPFMDEDAAKWLRYELIIKNQEGK